MGGLPEDKPFRPLPYVDLPVGLTEKEVDQFLREQRLEDLHRKLQLHQLEDADPDIRAPSPPPIYDKAGNRLNTRELRIRKSMLAEYNRLLRYMVRTIEGYVPPPDWRPQKLIKKIIIPHERFPTAPFMGVIIGARGVNHKRLQETTGCKIFIRGRDVGDKWQSDEELSMPQHVHIEADTEDQIEVAEKLITPLLNPESAEFEYARTHGMQQLAIVNGFTLSKQEHRCGVCGAIGHLGFECPETTSFNYKMANVVCTICGDHGHVASDCKTRKETDWKAEAERKQQMDSEYEKMMSELGMESQKPAPAPVPRMMPTFPPLQRPLLRPRVPLRARPVPPLRAPIVRPVSRSILPLRRPDCRLQGIDSSAENPMDLAGKLSGVFSHETGLPLPGLSALEIPANGFPPGMSTYPSTGCLPCAGSSPSIAFPGLASPSMSFPPCAVTISATGFPPDLSGVGFPQPASNISFDSGPMQDLGLFPSLCSLPEAACHSVQPDQGLRTVALPTGMTADAWEEL